MSVSQAELDGAVKVSILRSAQRSDDSRAGYALLVAVSQFYVQGVNRGLYQKVRAKIRANLMRSSNLPSKNNDQSAALTVRG